MDATTVVLAAVDGSDATEPVLRWAAVLAERVGSDVRVVHVDPPSRGLSDLTMERGHRLEELDGPVVGALRKALADEAVVLGVLGTRGVDAGPRPAGSTALAVLRTATKPILLVPPAGVGQAPARLGRVAVPLDGTQEVSGALQDVLDLLLRGGTDVLVVHVFDRAGKPAFLDRPARDTRLWAGEFLARHYDQVGARAVVLAGEPGVAALETSAAEGADAVVLAWRQDDAAGRAMTFKHVLSGSPVPVLVVPVGDRPS